MRQHQGAAGSGLAVLAQGGELVHLSGQSQIPMLPGGICHKGRGAISARVQGLISDVCPRPCMDNSLGHARVCHAGREAQNEPGNL